MSVEETVLSNDAKLEIDRSGGIDEIANDGRLINRRDDVVC